MHHQNWSRRPPLETRHQHQHQHRTDSAGAPTTATGPAADEGDAAGPDLSVPAPAGLLQRSSFAPLNAAHPELGPLRSPPPALPPATHGGGGVSGFRFYHSNNNNNSSNNTQTIMDDDTLDPATWPRSFGAKYGDHELDVLAACPPALPRPPAHLMSALSATAAAATAAAAAEAKDGADEPTVTGAPIVLRSGPGRQTALGSSNSFSTATAASAPSTSHHQWLQGGHHHGRTAAAELPTPAYDDQSDVRSRYADPGMAGEYTGSPLHAAVGPAAMSPLNRAAFGSTAGGPTRTSQHRRRYSGQHSHHPRTHGQLQCHQQQHRHPSYPTPDQPYRPLEPWQQSPHSPPPHHHYPPHPSMPYASDPYPYAPQHHHRHHQHQHQQNHQQQHQQPPRGHWPDYDAPPGRMHAPYSDYHDYPEAPHDPHYPAYGGASAAAAHPYRPSPRETDPFLPPEYDFAGRAYRDTREPPPGSWSPLDYPAWPSSAASGGGGGGNDAREQERDRDRPWVPSFSHVPHSPLLPPPLPPLPPPPAPPSGRSQRPQQQQQQQQQQSTRQLRSQLPELPRLSPQQTHVRSPPPPPKPPARQPSRAQQQQPAPKPAAIQRSRSSVRGRDLDDNDDDLDDLDDDGAGDDGSGGGGAGGATRSYHVFVISSYNAMVATLQQQAIAEAGQTAVATAAMRAAGMGAAATVRQMCREVAPDLRQRKRYKRLMGNLRLVDDVEDGAGRPRLAWRSSTLIILPKEEWNTIIDREHRATYPIEHHVPFRSLLTTLRMQYETRRSRCGIPPAYVEKRLAACTCAQDAAAGRLAE
ncbi:hypothetical protein BC828DRAFT_409674 [Blastocladiella britannica]|nr:hypothetical protein BC828DRAFT_409674 [Blastocladiella britannica]